MTKKKRRVVKRPPPPAKPLPEELPALDQSLEQTTAAPSLRMEACLRYVTNLNDQSIKQFWKQHYAEAIPWARLERWSYQDRWIERRKAFLAKLHDGLEERMRHTLTAQLHYEVVTLIRQREHILPLLLSDDPQTQIKPKSWESASKEVREINKRLAEIQGLTQGELTGATATTTSARRAEVSYSEEELRIGAKAILRERREQHRRQQAEKARAAAPKKTKKLKVVKGE